MKKLFITLLLLASVSESIAGETYWDLDTAANQVKQVEKIQLLSTAGVQQTLSKEYILNLYEVKSKIARASGIYPKVLISDSQEVNAFATWQNGQPVTVFTLGILNKIGSDSDALAAVMGHEFSHLTLQHGKSSQTTALVVDILAGLAMIAIDSSYGGSAYNPYRGLHRAGLDVVSNLTLTAYSRSDELEADTYGVRYMREAGYSPEGALRLHETIIPSSSSFFSTHPSSASRIQNIQLAMQKDFTSVENPTVDVATYTPNQIVNGSSSNTYLESAQFVDYAKVCEAQGINPNSSLFDVCVFKEKKKKDEELRIAKSISSLPYKGQIGTVISVKDKPSYVIFSTSSPVNLPPDAVVTIASESSPLKAKISRYYDGYYLAEMDATQGVRQGDRVLIDN